MLARHEGPLRTALRLAFAAVAAFGMIVLPEDALGYREAGHLRMLFTTGMGWVALAAGLWLAGGRPLLAYVARHARRADIASVFRSAHTGSRVGLVIGAGIGICVAIAFVDAASGPRRPMGMIVLLATTQATILASLWSAAGAAVGAGVAEGAWQVRRDVPRGSAQASR
jgi:hypothetical protein